MRVALALIVFLCCTANANAATVQYTQAPPQDPADHGAGESSLVDVVARPGEVNDIDVTDTDQVVVIRDAGAPLAAGSGCRAQPDGSVQCPRGDVSVEAGDMDDRVTVHIFAIVAGGDGDDVLAGDAAYLDGGAGDDVLNGQDLHGGPGRDRLTGTPEDDELDGGPGRDVIDGGGGTDELSYRFRTAPVVVDLAKSIAGGDTVTGVENIEGGEGNDRLAGDGGANRIDGGAGDDVILGRGGDDSLDGENGNDRVTGGPGDDIVLGERGDGGEGNDHFADARSVRCGPGYDDIFQPQRTMPIRPDCELIVPGHGLSWDVDVERPHLARSLSMTIHRDEDSGADRVRITVKAGGRVIGAHTSHLGDVRHRVTIPLSRPAGDVQIVFRTRYATTEFRFRAERPRAGTSARAPPRPGGRRRSGP